MARKTQLYKLVADICLYGNHTIGAGYLVQLTDGRLLGDGEPKAGRSFTEAVWLACRDVCEAGISAGLVRVFAPGGQRMADTDLNHPGYFGNLKWQPAIQYVLSVDELVDAAK